MKINLTQKLLRDDGQVMKEIGAPGEGIIDITLRHILSQALRNVLPKDRELGWAAQEDIFNLLLKVNSETEVDLNQSQIDLLKSRVKEFNASVVLKVQVKRILDGEDIGIPQTPETPETIETAETAETAETTTND